MVLLLPVGTESALRRTPRFTLVVIFLCAVLFPITRGEAVRRSEKELETLERSADWTLEVAARSDRRILADRAPHESALAYLDADDSWRRLVEDDELRARLEECRDESRALRERSPIFRHGLVPARVTPWRLFAHQLLHADLLHLL